VALGTGNGLTRLFVAIRPPATVREALLAAMGGVERARWQDEGQLHLTLRFVGEIDAPLANDLAASLGQVDAAPLELHVAGVGHFERKGRATALWAGLAPSPPLVTLQHKIERACQRVGLEPEHRKFTAHITLARLSGAAGPIGGWLATHGALAAPSWRVDEFRLYESVLAPGGSQYEPVVAYRLRG
jgi:2'-5' RNA ligase